MCLCMSQASMSVKVQPLFAIEVVTVYMSSELVLRLHKKWSHSQIKQCVYGNQYMSTTVVDLGVLGGECRFRQIL